MNPFPLELLCKKFKERFSAQLHKAGNDEARFQVYTAGLQEFPRRILPVLLALGAKEGMDSTSYLQGQQAASNLLMWLGFQYVRACQDFNAGVVLFTELIAACDDPVLKRRLVSYSNQLKIKWNKVEPGLSHNPRAVKGRNFKDHGETRLYIGISLLLLFLLIAVAHFKGGNHQHTDIEEVKMPLPTPADPYIDPVVSTSTQPRASHMEQSAPAPIPQGEVSGIYQFTDAQGGIHFVDQSGKIPADYMATAKFSPAESDATQPFKVKIDGDHVLVPVTLRNGVNSATALLLLDTGCTITTISEELASRLAIDSSATRLGTSRVADGRIISTRRARIDQLIVGNRSQPSAEVNIMPHFGDEVRYDGLLGMNFLRQHRYQVDYDNGMIRWQ